MTAVPMHLGISLPQQTNIVLTGFMGCGKSTVGRILADLLGYRFIDTDQLIVERSAMSVEQIFATQGEAAFRSLEEDLAQELGGLRGQVIATGGKMLLNPRNAMVLGAHGRIFCLTASSEEILRRVSGDGTAKRPLLQGDHPRERILALLEERREGYLQFIQIDTEAKSPKTVAEEIWRQVLAADQARSA